MQSDKCLSKGDIKKAGTIVWKNAKNYGVNCIGIFILYVGLAVLIQYCYNLKPLYSTAISNGLCSIFCLSIYFKHRLMGTPSYQPHNVLTKQTFISCSIYLLCSTFIILMLFYWSFGHVVDVGMENRAENLSDFPVSTYVWFSIFLAPFAEECIMRLFLYNALKRTSHWITAMLISSFTFAILHNTLAHTVLALCFGVVLTLIYEYTGSWWITIFYHMIYNLVSLFFNHEPFDFIINNTIIMVILFLVFIGGLTVATAKMDFQMRLVKYKDDV